MSVFDFVIVLSPELKTSAGSLFRLDGVFLCIYSLFCSWTSQNLMEISCYILSERDN